VIRLAIIRKGFKSMSIFGTPNRFGGIAQLFHWLTAALVLVAFLVSEGGPPSRVYGDSNAAVLQLHESLGMAVLTVVILRLLWRAFDRIPDDPPMPAWMQLSSKLVHWLLYGLLVLVPATAIAGAWLGGHPVTVYGLGPIGPFLSESAAGESLAEFHGLLGDTIMWVAGLHAAAALFHHFVQRDTVLRAMLPGGPG
jgi:cytochrome b561